MLHNSDDKVIDKNELQKSPISFLTKFFKWKKLCLKTGERNSCGSVYNDKLSRDETTKRLSCSVACIPSSVSVRDIMSPYPPSPALSMPSRNKNIDHDMEALRLSRQDDPFLKVLASRESLADSFVGETEQEGPTNLPQVLLPDVDPLTIPEFHKHMVRSPPPVNWPRSPVFRFENSSQESLGGKSSFKSHHYSRESMMDSVSSGFVSPNLSIPTRSSHRSSSAEAKERRCNSAFSLIPPTSFRSLSEVRRLHIKSSEDSQYLVTSSS
ncbi:uncharacterized protein LOC135845052 [Planococcus citri]|uniref:uncharacterized protein LOC135845052 n=1 Tax=Planococcus citri TaxID=170843 RepID=UPI0031F785E2